MLFNSYVFIVAFLPIALVGFFYLGQYAGNRPALLWLVACSLVFYGWGQPWVLLVLVPSIAVNAGIGSRLMRGVSATTRRWLLIFGIALNLGLLAFFKYAAFILSNVNTFVSAQLPVPEVVLPIGISFFTFTQIAYLSDAARGDVRDFSATNYSLFVTFFPHLIAGPIIHHREMMPQFAERDVTRLRAENIAIGLSIFTVGLFKKCVLADVTALWADPVFTAAAAGQRPAPAEAWVGTLAFAFQLYFDFSGYSDMAIGLARMFNIVLPLNFDSPYKATNIIEFWRRWHMTLSRFLRDYLYFPLGGNRRGSLRRYTNLLIVMILGGLWHGAAWTFVMWGAVHGVLLVINHAWQALRRFFGLERDFGRPGYVIARILTLVAVISAWVLFRAATIPAASIVLRSMYGVDGGPVLASLGAFAHAQAVAVKQAMNALIFLVAGVRPVRELPPSLGDLNLTALWLISVGIIALALPNTQELFTLNERPSLCSPARQEPESALRWYPSCRWAILLGLLFIASLLQLSKISPFLYYQF
jgi:alginate O-acetyltransferase complex protein AlgI